MKNTSLKINVLVIYKNGEAIEAIGIEDYYTDIQISNEILEELMTKYGYPDNRGGSEAKDFCGIYGEYEIKIEEKEILF